MTKCAWCNEELPHFETKANSCLIKLSKAVEKHVNMLRSTLQ